MSMKKYCVWWDGELVNDESVDEYRNEQAQLKGYYLISASSKKEAISVFMNRYYEHAKEEKWQHDELMKRTAKKLIQALCYRDEFAGTLKEKCNRLKLGIENIIYSILCEEEDWAYDDVIKYIQDSANLESLMNYFDDGEKRELWRIYNAQDVEVICLAREAR